MPLNGQQVLNAAASAMANGYTTPQSRYAGETVKTSAASLLAAAMSIDPDEDDKADDDNWPYATTEAAEDTKPKKQRATDPSQGMSSDFVRTEDPLTRSINALINGRSGR